MSAQREDFYGFHSFGNRDIQMVLREIDSEELAISLVGADNETISAIKRNMSENAILQLDRDIAAGERVPREKITAARDSITAIIKRLKQEGVILLQQ
ncbi:MAG TPA: FliG C-terminal domain-containing protein [Spirochaetota bacterium]|nr:FliG C-terminal domain-containing protein [Spirochaetota bacterium]